MKIAVVGSNGRVGSLVVKEALNRGFEVIGIAEGNNLTKGIIFIQKNAFDLSKDDLCCFDAVVDAVGGWTPETIPNITNVMNYLAEILTGTKTRLIVVGGAGSLFVNKEKTITVDMGKDFPDDWKPLSAAHGKGLKTLRNTTDLNWTYISPACDFIADGERTGYYKLGGEELIFNHKGESNISYADYAIALVDVIESGKFNKERISVVSK